MTRFSLLLVVLALAGAAGPSAFAALPDDTTDTAVRAPLDADRTTLLRSLNADDPATQERAVRLIGTYAHTGRCGVDFLDSFVVPLHGLVASGKTDALRLMAVSALASIGTDRAIAGLRAQVDRLPPSRVREVTEHAIAAHATRPAAATPR